MVVRALEKCQTDVERSYALTLIGTFSNPPSSSNKRSLELLVDIIENNRGFNALELFDDYKKSKNQYERLDIRYGSGSSQDLKDKYSKRPIGRRVSIFNKNTWIARGLTETEAIEKVKEIQSRNSRKRHLKATPNSYRNIPQCLEYWLGRGYDADSAEIQRQEFVNKHKISYANMIIKHGEEAGYKLVKEAHEKRKQSCLLKYSQTAFGKRISKRSMKFLIPLYRKCRKLGISKNDIYWGLGHCKEYAMHDNGKNYFYDFVIKSLKIAIEYNGTYWHPREDLCWRQCNMSKEEALASDLRKQELLKNLGYDVIVVWSDCDNDDKRTEIFEIIKKHYDNYTP
jgi:hypothetical protein